MSQEREPRRDKRGLGVSLSLTSIGLTLAFSVGIGIGLGFWLDGKFHSHGILVIVFTLVGVAAGFKQLIQDVQRASREQDRIDAEERQRRDGERRTP